MTQNNRLFELPGQSNGVIKGSAPCASGSFINKYLVAHYQKIGVLEKELGRLPEKEEFFFLQSDNSFNAFTFIPWICKQKTIKHLYAATYSINKRVINALCDLHKEGKIDTISICVSDTLIRRNPITSDLLASINKMYPNVNIQFAWVHAKVSLIDTGAEKFVVEGSGNWSENAKYEQYLFANSSGLFDFRMKLFTEVDVRYQASCGTIQKL